VPWDKREERNNYEAAVRALETAERAIDIKEDSMRQLIRDDIRSLNSAWNSYVIQREALNVAQRRVRSTTLFQQAGRSSTRDLLESESALLSARNSTVGAIVGYRIAGLRLRRDMAVLELDEEGLILED
jgi:outer membrane protein TolC